MGECWDPGGGRRRGDTNYDQYTGVTPGASETMDVSILRNKLTLELMSHAMAAICFNLYPNGVNTSHLTTLNGSLPPTLFPSVNIYRYRLSAVLLCYVGNGDDSPKKYDFCVGTQSSKLQHKDEWQGDYQRDLSRECGECHNNDTVTLSRRLRCYSRHVSALSRWRGLGRWELNLEQSSEGRVWQNLTRQQSPALGEFRRKIQNIL